MKKALIIGSPIVNMCIIESHWKNHDMNLVYSFSSIAMLLEGTFPIFEARNDMASLATLTSQYRYCAYFNSIATHEKELHASEVDMH